MIGDLNNKTTGPSFRKIEIETKNGIPETKRYNLELGVPSNPLKSPCA